MRPPTEDDAEQIFARYAQDAEVCRYMSWIPHRSIDDTREFLDANHRRQFGRPQHGLSDLFAQLGELLGSIGGAIEKHRMQFGYRLARDAWGHGFATEAATAFVAPSRCAA